MSINLGKLTPAQRTQLKANNPALYQANIGSLPGSKVVGDKGRTLDDIAQDFGAGGLDDLDQFLDTLPDPDPKQPVQNANQRAQAQKAARELNITLPNLPTERSDGSTRNDLPTSGSDKVSTFLDGISNESGSDRSPLMQFNAVLESVLGIARNRRRGDQFKALTEAGFTPGNVDPGTMSALLNSLESRNAGNFGDLLDTGSRGFESAVDAEQAQAQQVQDERNQIRDLALTLQSNGASQDAIQAVLTSKNIDSAILAAAGIMQNVTDDGVEVRQVGSKLVKIDDEGNVELLFDGTATNNPDGSSRPNFEMRTVGGDLYEVETDPNTGQILNQRKIINSPSGGGVSPTEKTISSGGLVITQADLGNISSQLEGSRGDDGYVNTTLYADAYNRWVNNQGIGSDFVNKFPPENYLNSEDPTVFTSLPPFVTKKLKEDQISNPF